MKEKIVDYKKNISKLVEDLNLFLVNNIKNFSVHGMTANEEFEKIVEKVKNKVLEGNLRIEKEIEFLKNELEWNNLNISFFGETNAGKSTIIEALTNGDGSSIGEGYKDFTKFVKEKSFSDINLIDMPGIEGDEEKVIDEIKKALNKSHIVFYVIGTNKEPEENIVSRIKNFLKDNAKVYSIINVRGKPSRYKYEKELVNNDVETIEKRTILKLKKILGRRYFGNIIINAHLALLKNDSLNDRFAKDKEKALEIFGSKSNIENFSNIKEIEKIIAGLRKEIFNEIVISNTYKILFNVKEILSSVVKQKKSFDLKLRKFSKLIEDYISEVNKLVKKYKVRTSNELQVKIASLKNKLEKFLMESIDKSHSLEMIKKEIEKILKEEEQDINQMIKDNLNTMKEKVEQKFQELLDKFLLECEFENLFKDFNLRQYFEIDIEEIFNKPFSFLKFFLGLGGIGLNTYLIFNLMGYFALGVLVYEFISLVFISSEKDKIEYKNNAVKEVDLKISKVKSEMEKKIDEIFSKIEKDVEENIKNIRLAVNEIKNLGRNIDELISYIKKIESELSLLLVKNILGEKVEFAYIDLELSKAIFVGFKVNSDVNNYIENMFRLDKIYFYTSKDEWMSSVVSKKVEKVIYVTDEFDYRALNLLFLNNKDGIRIRKFKKPTN
ncbi:GTPase domain-containing protein [Thermosipho globiformans]|uniref:GTPase domain-containing protein n=1 Tax=Thermosipho globiformans TaxID=380685 RepID=UPI000F8F02D2|nr:GTPase domain-containing protein [Thermosipho globiformans]